jgi:anti-sigma factor RsiW
MATSDDFSCRDFTERVTDYLEEALDPETTTGLERHLGVCPGCRTYLAQMKRTIAAIGAALRSGPAADSAARLRALFRNRRAV